MVYNDADYEIINQCWLRLVDVDGGRIDRLPGRHSAVGMSRTGGRPSDWRILTARNVEGCHRMFAVSRRGEKKHIHNVTVPLCSPMA
jgi:hypothetical protein